MKKLFLLDAYPILFRAHFAMTGQHLQTTSGINTSAILGFCNYLFQIIFKEKPSHIAAAFDNQSFERTAILKEYKGTRDKAPTELSQAKDYVKEIIDALNIKQIEQKGQEADDIIGTIATQAASAGFEVYIVSPDKDFAQLVSENIYLYRPPYKGLNFEVLDSEKVKKKYGVYPEKIPDFLALKGDTADNIPGVPKIGDKTASDLLAQFDSVEQILANKARISKPSVQKTLSENEDKARLSKQLATIVTTLNLSFKEKEFRLKGPKVNKLAELLDKLEFVRLKERIFSNSFYKKTFKPGLPEKDTDPETAVDTCKYKILNSPEELEQILQSVKKSAEFNFLTKVYEDYADIYFYFDDITWFIHIKNTQLPQAFTDILYSKSIRKITYGTKCFFKYFYEKHPDLFRSIHKAEVYDVELEHYLTSPDSNHALDKILSKEQGVSFYSSDTKTKKCFEVRNLENLHKNLHNKLKTMNQADLYKDIDYPLASVLAKMEMNGIKVDKAALQEISRQFQNEMAGIESRIYDLAGERFNINSSKQTAEIFSRIVEGAPVKRTKTGQVSTSEASLMEFSGSFEIADQLLRYRKISKLLSTYTESLPKHINPKTGRIHADFKQTSTATGRLSCINPNLQNLPIRSEEGREVRKAVIPENDDYLILSADYSQIELRLIAALSKDEGLASAFTQKKDVHTITAARVFNFSESDVTADMRSKAKMVNYGIAYGISPFGLSQNLKISLGEAKEIINEYFKKFPRVKQFVETTINFARKNGFSETLTGRRRYINDINSRNGTERRAAERIAINAPLQGLAADIIKMSMIEINNEFTERNLRSKMIMQIHDELVFEVFKSELNLVTDLVKSRMENCIKLPVPIEINAGLGKNWLELEEI